ncbi:nitronate monooxygenase [Tardiphaga sp. 709]|uniref:nitronate monooxygenase n=1 Tax=Tardiphaga sp. 709 TaxID=3076039 RepID=UPI0028EC541F|nr:nitronate monooxygenase [Tardiphaga sp. 709]WNV12530.1 nitronate monooxygenase [Tardiphaga sp. 709]
MTPAAGGVLASAVSDAGALGLLGGGYGDRQWFEAESAKISHDRVGCGFITWSVTPDTALFDLALDQRPTAMMLSFGDPAPLGARVKQRGIPLICQVHTIEHAKRAIDVGADVIVAQGTEAGGHGFAVRSTMPFVPDVVDLCAVRSPRTLVAAAGGIADGRGLAAALMLGADGVLMGTRFWATQEALIHEDAKRKSSPRAATIPFGRRSTTSFVRKRGRSHTRGACSATNSSSSGTAARPSSEKSRRMSCRRSKRPASQVITTLRTSRSVKQSAWSTTCQLHGS